MEQFINEICQDGTNLFINQDIVQTTNFDTWRLKYDEIKEKNKPEKKLKEYADGLGIIPKTFYAKYKKLGNNLEATINFYRQKHQMQ